LISILIDKEIAEIYSQLKNRIFRQFAPKEKNKRRSTRIQDLGFDDNDLWIAATAIYHNIILVSALQGLFKLMLDNFLATDRLMSVKAGKTTSNHKPLKKTNPKSINFYFINRYIYYALKSLALLPMW